MTKFEKLKKEYWKASNELERIEKEMKKVASELRKSVKMQKKKNYTILTRKDGKAVLVPNETNSYNERTIYDYSDGKKGEPLLKHDRKGINALRLWFAEAKL